MKKRIDSFKYAFRGIEEGVREQTNIKIHLAAAIVAIGLSAWLQISATEWAIIFLCIGGVISLELINTAIEKLCDFVEPNRNEKIRIIKDIAAAAVLVASIISVIVAIFIFGPKTWGLI